MTVLPDGWKVTGWGPLGEGVEATGPQGQTLIALLEEDLPGAIRQAENKILEAPCR